MLTQRQLLILKSIIEKFTSTAEPVGSKTLLEEFELPYSSATIRSEMAELEAKGYLEKTHTSSGRVPSLVGYRYYTDYLMDEGGIETELVERLEAVFKDRQNNMNDVIKQSCEILSELTNLTSMVLGPDANNDKLQRVSLITLGDKSVVAIIVTDKGHVQNRSFNLTDDIAMVDVENCVDVLNNLLIGTPISQIINKLEQEVKPVLATQIRQHEILFNAFLEAFVKFSSSNVYFSGKSNIIYQPEFSDVNKLRKLMTILEDTDLLKDLTAKEDGLMIRFSEESPILGIDNVAVISSTYTIEDGKGTIAVIGPKRMKYDKVVALLEYIVKNIDDLMSGK